MIFFVEYRLGASANRNDTLPYAKHLYLSSCGASVYYPKLCLNVFESNFPSTFLNTSYDGIPYRNVKAVANSGSMLVLLLSYTRHYIDENIMQEEYK